MEQLIEGSGFPAAMLFGDDAEIEFMEPRRVVITPLELCLLSNEEDLFGDEDD